MKLRGLLLALCVVACGPPAEKAKGPEASQAPDPFELQIEIGRYSVMLDQTENLTAERPDLTDLNRQEPRALARSLRHVVWQYNLDRSRLCARGILTEASCGPSLQPVWIAEPDTAEPSLQELQERSTAVGEEVMRFWNAVCEDARARETDEQERMYVCAIE